MQRFVSILPAILSAALVAAFCGCGDPKKPSDSNFEKAIDQHLVKQDGACVAMTGGFPSDVPDSQLRFHHDDGLKALAKAGLLRSSRTVAKSRDMFGESTNPEPMTRYELTDEGKKYLRQSKGGFFGSTTQLCYGQEKVDAVVKWTEPANLGPVTMTEVTYTYKLADVAGWAKRPDVQAAFPGIQREMSGQSTEQRRADLQLTNKGWEIPGE